MTDEPAPETKPNKATPAEAQALWNAVESPTPRLIARLLTEQGKSVSHTTISRWLAHDWDARRHAAARRTSALIFGAMQHCPPGVDLQNIEGSPDDKVVEICGREVIEVTAMALRAVRGKLRHQFIKPSDLRDISGYIRDLAAAMKDGSAVFAQGIELRKRGAELMAPINPVVEKASEPEPVTITQVGNELAEDMLRWDRGEPPLKKNGNGSSASHAVSES